MKLRNLTLLTAIVLGGGAFALNLAARSAAQRISSVLAPVAKLDFEGAGISLNGSIRLDSPRLVLGKELDKTRLRADVAYLRGSGFTWLIGYLLDDAEALPESLSITMRGFDLGDGSSRAGLSDWIGLSSRALFENAGCGSDALGAKDYAKMGVTPETSTDQVSYRHDPTGNRLELSFDLDSPGMARWQGTAELKGFDPGRWPDERARQSIRVVRAALGYTDPGFLARRNRFCANWLGINADQFVTRHVDAVKSLLSTHGIQPSTELTALYERIVSRGGTLNISSLPKDDWIPAEWMAYPRQDLLRQLNVTARLEDAPPIMLDLTFTDPEVPLYRVTADPIEVPVVEAPIIATVQGDAPKAPSEKQGAEPDGSTGSPPLAGTPSSAVATTDPPQIHAPTPPTEPARVEAEPPAKSGGVIEAVQAPVETTVASSEPPPPGSTLALVWKPGEIQRLPPAESPKPAYAVIPTSQISAHVGERIQLLTEGGRRVDGELKSVRASEVTLTVEASSGRAELTVPLAKIREARLKLKAGDR